MASIQEFRIPSLYDGVLLECRIQHPPGLQEMKEKPFRSGAIIAHPYAPLGGCFDDPVVCSIAEVLLSQGFMVGTFNFRGSGKSQGRTSWTARPEIHDYVSFLTLFVKYLLGLQMVTKVADDLETPHRVDIICGGYSYGSLVASRLVQILALAISDSEETSSQAEDAQGCHTIQNLLLPGAKGFSVATAKAEVDRTTVRLVKQYMSQQSAVGQESHTLDEVSNPTQWLENAKMRLHYLLVSPLLPPVTTFLSPFSGGSMWTFNKNEYIELTQSRTLAVFGDQDVFTSGQKLLRWAEALSKMRSSKFGYKAVPGVGHFWREHGATQALSEALCRWIISDANDQQSQQGRPL